jgi:TonB-like protein
MPLCSFSVLFSPMARQGASELTERWVSRSCCATEVLHKLREAHFIPAVYNHQRVFAQFEGTVAFSIIDGKPHLRIFANQEMSELQKETDFIDPQIIEIPGHIYDFVNIQYPSRSWASEDQPGAAEITLSTDASGHVKDVRLTREIPPGNKFGEVAMKIMKQRTFLPAFRNGKPVDSTIHFVQYFTPEGWGLQ